VGLDEAAHEGVAVRVEAGRREAEQGLSGGDAAALRRALESIGAPHLPDAEAFEIIDTFGVDAGHLGRLAADERAARRFAGARR
jgi:hypothetical protein